MSIALQTPPMVARVLTGLLIVIVVAVIGFVAWASRPAIAPMERPPGFDRSVTLRGEQLASLGNCVECHTAPAGKAYAGGYPLDTPFGTIYGTNITPDPETGIGRWSLDAFTRAMREGLRRDGRHLYPAFPYDHYTLLTDADIAALYAYLMTREPVHAETPANKLIFPLNVRLLIAGWKALYLRHAAFKNNTAESAEWNRGAYLVQGLAHCGACHTPRNLLGAEKRDAYLTGADIRGWTAPPLNAASRSPVPWTAQTLHQYLRQGLAENHAVAAGPMAPVVSSLRGASDEDVRAMAVYIESLMKPGLAERENGTRQALARAREDAAAILPPVPQTKRDASQDAKLQQGARIYAGTCAMCHGQDRRTLASGDALHFALSTAVALPKPTNLIRVTLKGLSPPDGERGPMMPGFAGALTDEQVAALVIYLRAEFSDRPEWKNVEREVRSVRQSLGE